MRSRSLVLAALGVVLCLSACGSSEEADPSPAGSDGGDKNASSGNSDAAPSVEIVDYGFGQNDYNVEGIVVVTTESEAAIGESVTVSVNFLDANGQILETAEQVESFNWVGQQLVLPVNTSEITGDSPVASIEPSVTLSDHGTVEPSKAALPVLDSTEITGGDGNSYYKVSFAFTNDTEADLEDLRVGVVCYDGAQKIVGGGSEYPDLAPAGKSIRIDTSPDVSAKPASCKAFVNYNVF